MAIVSTNDAHYKHIADKIRTLSGTTGSYTPEQMSTGIEDVYENGRSDGWFSGYGEGHAEGYATGEDSQRRIFWDAYQQEGDRTDYNFAFAGAGWTEETFWPRHNITAVNGYQVFAYCAFAGSLKDRLAECRVKLEFANSQMVMNLFSYANKITELGVIDLSSVTPSSNNSYIFNQCTALHTIEKLVVPVNQPAWTGWFSGCSALENIRIEGTIVHTGLSFADSPKLTRESMLSVIEALADKGSTTGTWKVTFGAANLAKLTDSDKTVATAKGWTLV